MSASAKSQPLVSADATSPVCSVACPKVTYQCPVRAVSPLPPAVSPIPPSDDQVDATLLLEISRSSLDDDLEVSSITSQYAISLLINLIINFVKAW